jgi:hypothetical protein
MRVLDGLLLASWVAFVGCGGSKATGGKTTGAGGGASGSSSSGTTSGSTSGTIASTTGSSSGAGAADGGTGGSAPTCGTEGWLTYNHDAQRTGASGGCVAGPLTTKWRYVPAPPASKTLKNVFNALAQTDAVFLAWAASDASYLGTSAADRLDLTGARVWTFDSGTDSNLGNWPTVALGQVILNEDGIYLLDATTGAKKGGNGVDNWGQTLSDGTNLYAVNDSHVDGPSIYVGAYDPTGKQLWTANSYGTCRIDAGDIAGGLALDAGVLFYAPSYSLGTGVTLAFGSGLYAFDPTTGKQSYFQAASPTSGISAAAGLVYLIEGGATLVARKQIDGTMAWSASVPSAGTQAPVVAAGKVVVAGNQAVLAFDAATGKPAWSAPITGAEAQAFDLQFSGGCVAGSGQWSGNAFGTTIATTTLAAALGSGTLVVTASDGIHLLALATGSETWSGMPAQAVGAVKNPSIVNGAVYVIDQGGLLALAAP